MRTNVTSTRSKVKVKVTELPKKSALFYVYPLRHFGVELKTREFKLRPISIFDEIQMAIFR